MTLRRPQGLKPRILSSPVGSAEAEPLQSWVTISIPIIFRVAKSCSEGDGRQARTDFCSERDILQAQADSCFEKDCLEAVRKDALFGGGFSRWGSGSL